MGATVSKGEPPRLPVRSRAGLRTSLVASLALVAAGTLGCSSAGSRHGSSAPLPPDAIELRDAQTVMDFAWAQVGKRYCWGGTGPSCFDCSGLVQRAWATVGVRLPRTADAIATTLPEVPLEVSQLRAGDILWWPGHVGLYAGGGWVVEALDHRHGVIRRAIPAHHPPQRAFRPWGQSG
ncbi:MAG TPA: NlpC/P60 family protein [Polyangiaceae bacterium]|nr:NlpC/P60 family protein [Polyangiaceae bacterium]